MNACLINGAFDRVASRFADLFRNYEDSADSWACVHESGSSRCAEGRRHQRDDGAALFSGEDAIGKPIGLGVNGYAQRAEIVGIVGNVRHAQLDQPPGPDAYVSLFQAPPPPNVYLFARSVNDPIALTPVVRQQVAALNRDLPIYDVQTMANRVSNAASRARFNAILLGIFATIAMVLAAIGIYGVVSYTVRQRTREIGIRAAVLIFAGTLLGLAGALAATQVLETFLYEVKPDDPQTYLLIAVLLAGVALLASYVPARRASVIDPAITLRTE